MKTVLVTGAGGQLATELVNTCPAGVELVLCQRADLDIGNFNDVKALFSKHQFDAVINAAAYTAVDKAESEKERAFDVNAAGIENLAKACSDDCYLLHISTDFVFNGEKNRPYSPDDVTDPIGIYGESKLLGEQKLMAAKPSNSCIIRTAWVYSCGGGNFVNSMLRYMAERDELNIVVDQVGTPTWAKGLAEVCWQSVDAKLEGCFHWSDAGAISWFDFAAAIQTIAIELGLLQKEARLNAIPSEAYPTPARRPAYSVLDKTKILKALPQLQNLHWQKQLRSMLQELKEKG